MTLNIGEDAAIQMMTMAIELYKENPRDPKEIANDVIDATKEMILRGNIKGGIIVGDSEK